MANEVEILEEYAKQIEEEAAATKAEEAKEVAYKDIDLQYIIDWCKANNQVAWLKKTAEEKVETKVYPRKKVAKLDNNGQPVLNAKGKVVHVSIADKSKEPKIEEKDITFLKLKEKFAAEFMPELLPQAKPKKQTMLDIIAAL